MSVVARHYDTSAASYHEQYEGVTPWSSADYQSNLFLLDW